MEATNKHPRKGKTERDHKSGAWDRRYQNLRACKIRDGAGKQGVNDTNCPVHSKK